MIHDRFGGGSGGVGVDDAFRIDLRIETFDKILLKKNIYKTLKEMKSP